MAAGDDAGRAVRARSDPPPATGVASRCAEAPTAGPVGRRRRHRAAPGGTRGPPSPSRLVRSRARRRRGARRASARWRCRTQQPDARRRRSAPASLPRPAGHVRSRVGCHRHPGVHAAGLTPVEGHTIFAYVAIAVYDSVMAVSRTTSRSPSIVDAPAGASAEAAVAAAAHARPRPLPPRPGSLDPRSGIHGIAGHAPDGSGEDRRHRHRRAGRCARSSPCVPTTGSGPPVTYTPAEPAGPGRLAPDRRHPADRHLPRADAARSRSTPPTSSVPTARRRCVARSGHATTTRSRRSARARARPGPPSRRSPPGSGPRPRCSRHAARSAASSSTTSSTSSRQHGSWR